MAAALTLVSVSPAVSSEFAVTGRLVSTCSGEARLTTWGRGVSVALPQTLAQSDFYM